MLTAVDRAALAAYCQAYGRWVEAEERLREAPLLYKTPSGYVQQSPWLGIVHKQLELMGRYMTELGMTPAARSRVMADSPLRYAVATEPMRIERVIVEHESRHRARARRRLAGQARLTCKKAVIPPMMLPSLSAAARRTELRNERLAVLVAPEARGQGGGGACGSSAYKRVSTEAAGGERARARGTAEGDRGDLVASAGRETLSPASSRWRAGSKADRPELEKALHLAKVTGSTLLIAKLDRLSRNAAFLLTLRDSGVRFAAVDLPEANDLTVGIMALVAQAEREAISKRTREALAIARSRGVKLGNPNGAAALRRSGQSGTALRAAIARNADRHALDLAPVVEDIRAGGAVSLRAIAAELNARGMLTRRGGRWHVSTVTNLLDRLGLREAACGSPN